MRLTMPVGGPEWIQYRRIRVSRVLRASPLFLLGLFCVCAVGPVSAQRPAPGTAGAKAGGSPVLNKGAAPAAKPRRPNTPGSSSPAPNAVASPGHVPELAVVYDGSYRVPAKDLQLTLENDRKAEADAHFIQGLLLEDTADADKAQDEYLKSLALDPANVDLSIKLAVEQLRRGDTPAAIGLLKDTIKAAPKKPQPYLALAYVYLKGLDKADMAQKYAAQALDVDPTNIAVYLYLKEIYTALNQPAKVAALLDRASKVDTRDAAFWVQLGGFYADVYLKGDGAKAPDNLKKTTAIFQKALGLDGNNLDVLNQTAKFFVDTQQYGEAVSVYQKIVQINPDQTAARETLARCYLNNNQRDKAVATLEELIKLNPVQGHAYSLLGGIYEDAGEFDKASQNYQQSLLISPNQQEGYWTTALMFLQHLKKPEKAAEVLTEARRRFPDQPKFSYLLAVSLTGAKKYQEAMTVFEQALLEAQTINSDLLSGGDFFFRYGNAAEEAGMFDKAAELLHKALNSEDDPRQVAEYSNYLGYMWVEHDKNLDEAGDLIRKALEIDPDNGAFLDSMGWYYYKASQYDKALVQLTRAVEIIKPEDAVVYEHLGDTYSKLHDVSKAVDCWQKALGLHPEEPNKTAIAKKVEDSKAQMTQVQPSSPQ